MRELIISENDANQRVDKFLTKALPTLPKNLMYKYIRNKKIKVNKKRCEISQRLVCGDVMQCYIAEEFFESPRSYDFLQVPSTLAVVYEDDTILVAYKPIGVLAQKDQTGIQDNMNDRLLHYLYRTKQYDPSYEQSFTPAFAHRLDRNTEGLLVAGKSAGALRSLNECIKAQKIKKYYLCLVEGSMSEIQGELKLYHKKNTKTNKAEVFDHEVEGSLLIHTSYQVKEVIGNKTLIEVELHTGKSHQIRVSFAHIGYPLYGDVKYGAKKAADYQNQALCAYKIKFAFEEADGTLQALKNKEILLKDSVLLQYIRNLKKG